MWFLRSGRRFFWGLLFCFAFAVFHTTAHAQESYISGVKNNNSTVAWEVRDCHTPWNNDNSTAAALRADCNLRTRGTWRYAYPKIEWRTFGPTTVTAAFDKWKTAYAGTDNALGELRAAVLAPADSQKKWTPKIVYSGDVSALSVFSDVMAVTSAATTTTITSAATTITSTAPAAIIGGIAVNAQNKRQVQVHTRKINNIGTAPILFALYDQYQGHLYLHAYKSKRTTGKHVEVLHARLSPLHLGFLRGGGYTDNPFHKFYTAADAYLFDRIDFAGAITAAGQLAKHLGAAQVIIFAPLIDFDIIRIKHLITEFKHADLENNFANLKPRWFYGIPQVSGGGGDDNKIIGFTGAICANASASINAEDCAAKDFFPSYLAVMKVSRFSSALYDGKVINSQYLTQSEPYIKILPDKPDLLAFPVGDIAAAGAGAMATRTKQRDIFSILNNMRANNILLEGYSAGNGFFTGASYVAESRTVYLNRISNLSVTLSNGQLNATFLETKAGSDIKLLMSNKIKSKDIAAGAGAIGFESVKRLFQGTCGSRDKRADCVIKSLSAGIVPRADDFVPYAGGDLVAPRLSTEKVKKALEEARKQPKK